MASTSAVAFSPFSKLSNELIAHILLSTLDRAPALNLTQLLLLQKISMDFVEPARRLIFRDVYIRSPEAGKKFAECLKRDADLGKLVRTLTIHPRAYRNPSVFHDIIADDIVRATPLLVSLDNAVANFAPLLDGRRPQAFYPSTLRTFRFSLSAPEATEDSDYDSDDDESISSDSELDEEDLQTPAKERTTVPRPFRRLEQVGNQVDELILDRVSSRHFLRRATPTPIFPLQYLECIAISISPTITPEIIKWMMKPSVDNGTLKRLKLWRLERVDNISAVEIVKTAGPKLEELYWQGSGAVASRMMMAVCPNLKRLTFGASSSPPTIFTLLPSKPIPTLTHLCLNIHETISLDELLLNYSTKLSSLRRLELYTQIYFPPPLEVDFLDDHDLLSGSQLREIRLSHTRFKSGHLDRLFALVGKGIRIMSLHHVEHSFAALIGSCPRLVRLELGVALVGERKDDWLSKAIERAGGLDRLHLLRVHLISGVTLAEIVKLLKGGKLKGLNTLDICGVVPSQVPESWTGKLFDALLNESRKRQIHVALNGKAISSTGDLWGAMGGAAHVM